MLQNGKILSMHNDAVYKGDFSHNGTLLKLHENSYTIGYSALLSKDGTQSGEVKFGDGVFYNAKEKNNRVYAGAPTVEEAVPVFAGIMVREPAIASGYPVLNDEVNGFQHGLIVKEGYVIYKSAPVGNGSDKVNVYDSESVTFGTSLFIRASDGGAYFGSAKADGSDVLAGKVVELNPDDKSVTVYVSPLITV